MRLLICLALLAAVVSACGASPTQAPIVVIATQPPLPTYTPYPTYTPQPPLPTYTPFPTWTIPPRPTDTPKPSPTPTPKQAGSTRDNPVGFNTPATMGDGFEMTVLASDGDAWPKVQAANQFNKPPADGKRMVMLTVRVKSASTPKEPATWSDMDIALLGSYNRPWTTFGDESNCGVINQELSSAELYKGGQKEGNLCFQIPKDETNLLLRYETGLLSNAYTYLAAEIN